MEAAITTKRFFCIIISICIWSACYADEIPYEQLSDSLVEKLQQFGLKSIEHYSMALYGSNDSESLMKTKDVIDSFKSNKDVCSQFIYYWWQMWAPQSGRGFIENAKLTKGEAFTCCLIGELVSKKKEIARIEIENELYSKWITEGVPSTVSPSTSAELQVYPKEKFAQFISDNRTQDNYMKSIRVKIGADRRIECLSSDEEDFKLLELLNVRASSSATYLFENSGKSIPMESVVSIIIEENRHEVSSKLYFKEYEATVTFNKKTSSWDINLTKSYIEHFTKDTSPNTKYYLDAISRALNSLETKPKKYIRFQILDSKLYVSYKWNNGSKVLEFIDLPPIAIIKSSHR